MADAEKRAADAELRASQAEKKATAGTSKAAAARAADITAINAAKSKLSKTKREKSERNNDSTRAEKEEAKLVAELKAKEERTAAKKKKLVKLVIAKMSLHLEKVERKLEQTGSQENLEEVDVQELHLNTQHTAAANEKANMQTLRDFETAVKKVKAGEAAEKKHSKILKVVSPIFLLV